MGLLGTIIGALFGGSSEPKDDFAKLDPNDLEAWWRVDHELDQAERESPAALAQVRAHYGVRDEDHWSAVRASFHRRHSKTAEYFMAPGRAQVRVQLQDMSRKHYEMPSEYIVPVEGVWIDRLCLVQVRLAAAPMHAPAILAEYGLDPARWSRIEATWQARMGPNADAMAGNILRGFHHLFICNAQAWLQESAQAA
jgi:hypothetical protein